jgi:hypothetical protein
MAHGYLREYDEGWDRDDDRNRRDEGRPRERNSGDRDERGRDFMFGERDRNRDRPFFGREDDEARERFAEDDRQWRGTHQNRWSSSDWQGSGEDEWRRGHSPFTSGSDRERSPRNLSSRQDDDYRSWRDKQMEALDRDYADYCREREQQFHQDFGTWRTQRRGNNPGPLRTGMAQTGQSHEPSGMLELTNEATENAEPHADPMDAATLGTASSSGGRS